MSLNSSLKYIFGFVILVILFGNFASVQGEEFPEYCINNPDITAAQSQECRRISNEIVRNLGEDYYCLLKSDISASEASSLIGESYKRNKGEPVLVKYPNNEPAEWGALCVYSSFKNIVNIIKIGIFIVSMIVFTYAGAVYATSGENERRQSQAKSFLLSGVVGLIIAGVAHIIPSLVTFLF